MYEELLSNLGLQHVTKYLANFTDFPPYYWTYMYN